MRIPLLRLALPAAVLALASCGGGSSSDPAPPPPAAAVSQPAAVADVPQPAAATPRTEPAPDAARVSAVEVAGGLRRPWGFAFMPDGRALVTERGGSMRIVSTDGSVSAPLAGVPAVFAQEQGGLLDIVLSPSFATDRTIFFSFSEAAAGGESRAAVARAVLGDGRLESVSVIHRAEPSLAGAVQYGSRLAVAPDGTLFVGLGDRDERDRVQDLSNELGKVVRIATDGSIPLDDPFVGRSDVRPAIWAWGFRNIQGATIEPATGRLWTVEHGPLGGDEVNTPLRGANHGWPVIGYGREYGSGEPVGEGTTRADVVPPQWYWVPTSIAPSGMAFYGLDGPQAGWRGDLFVGALAGKMLVRLQVRDGRIVSEQRLLTGLGERIRDVRTGPGGHLYLITDADPGGRLMRVEVR